MNDDSGSAAKVQEPPSHLPPTVKLSALRIAGKGKPVFPCKPNKAPYTRRGFKDATTQQARVSMFWTRFPDALIGMPTGAESGVFVVDVDRVEALGELPGELPETLTVRTRSGGLHLYFRYVDGLTNSAGRLPSGIDVRGEGGYVIVPPSPGYRWENRAPVAELPSWLVDLLRRQPERTGAERTAKTIGPVDLDDTSPIPDGGRNMTLTSIGGRLRSYGLKRGEIEASLMYVNRERCSPPLEAAEVRQIAASVSRYAPGKGSPPPDARTRAEIDRIEAELWEAAWPRTSGKSERSLTIVALKLARRHGRPVPGGGIEVSVSHRVLALMAATSRKSVQRVISRSEWLRQGRGREGRKTGTVVISTPSPLGSANCPHSNQGGRIEEGIGVCGDSLRGPSAAFTSPRLRWSAPGILRLGKSSEAVVDYLERTGGSATIDEAAKFMHVSRIRDFRRRVVDRLEERGIITVTGDTMSLVDNWLNAINAEREVSGEIAAYRRDVKRFNLERDGYANRHVNRPEAVPPMRSWDSVMSGKWEREDGPVSSLAVALRDYLRHHSPADASQPPGWLAVTLWVEGRYPTKVTPKEIRSAFRELGDDTFKLECLKRAEFNAKRHVG